MLQKLKKPSLNVVTMVMVILVKMTFWNREIVSI